MAEHIHRYALVLTEFCFVRAVGAHCGRPMFTSDKADIQSRIRFPVIVGRMKSAIIFDCSKLLCINNCSSDLGFSILEGWGRVQGSSTFTKLEA